MPAVIQNSMRTAAAKRRLAARRSVPRSGATLIELLVVIVIMTILAAAAVPILAPALNNRQVREASRIVSGFLTGARNRAMLSGRPVGVVLDRLQGLPDACVALSYAEVPPAYAGDSMGSFASITGSLGAGGTFTAFVSGLSPAGGASTDVGWQGTVRVGDLIRFNYQGPYFQIGMPSNASSMDASGFLHADPASGASYAWPITRLPGSTAIPPLNANVPYQIIRAPMKMAAGGVQLPGPTVIDLDFSGFDAPNNYGAAFAISPWTTAGGFQPLWPPAGVDPATYASQNPFNPSKNDATSIVITFAPSGAVDTVWCWQPPPQGVSNPYLPGANPVPAPYKPITPIRLLVGRRELLPLPASAPTNPAECDPTSSVFKPYANWHDPGCFWVSINQQSGLVTTVENNAPQSPISNSGYGSFAELQSARQFALDSQRMGGR